MHYAVMFFMQPCELYPESNIPEEYRNVTFINTGICITQDHSSALNIYANTPNPASQLLEAETAEDLKDMIERRKIEMNDNTYLDMCVWPYL